MRVRNLKGFLALLIFFLLDTQKPFGYSLMTEFTFLGIILISLNYPLNTSIILAIVFGYLKDALCINITRFSLFEFIFIAMFIHYCLHNLHRKAIKIIVFLCVLIVHIIISNFNINKPAYLFSLLFFIHSSIIFLLVNRLFTEWLSIGIKNYNAI